MENLMKHLGGIDASFKTLKYITLLSVAASSMVAITAVTCSVMSIRKGQEQIYILDKGSAIMASHAGKDTYRDLEAEDHVLRFHELMFNLSPNRETIKRNLDRALLMSDRSAYEYWMDLSEKGFFQRIVSANISQEIVVDSVKVDMTSYPYNARTMGKLFLMWESNITAYEFESSCRLVDTERSPSNPHGMMIEKFAVTRNRPIGTRRRK